MSKLSEACDKVSRLETTVATIQGDIESAEKKQAERVQLLSEALVELEQAKFALTIALTNEIGVEHGVDSG